MSSPAPTLLRPPTNYRNLTARCERIAAAFGFGFHLADIERLPPSRNPADIALILRAELHGVAGLTPALRRPLIRRLAASDFVPLWCHRAVSITTLFYIGGETEFVLTISPTPFALRWSATRGLDDEENEPLLAPVLIRGLFALGHRAAVAGLSDHFGVALSEGERAALQARMQRAGFRVPDYH